MKIRRAPTTQFDEFVIPDEVKNSPHLFSYVAEHAPAPLAHDYILYTDGSGCNKGWGASAAIVERVADIDERIVNHTEVIVSATYGSTVQRREFTALLDGLHWIFTDRLRYRKDDEVEQPTMTSLTREERVTVLWYTDRANLAKSLLFDEFGDCLNDRSSERDLWMRYSYYARHLCITPMAVPRNTIPLQERCDALCSAARETLMGSAPSLNSIIDINEGPKKQTALL